MEREMNKAGKLEYYLAQIALEVRRSFAKRKQYKLADFLLKFVRSKGVQRAETVGAQTERSKSFWMAALGLVRDKFGKVVSNGKSNGFGRTRRPPRWGSKRVRQDNGQSGE